VTFGLSFSMVIQMKTNLARNTPEVYIDLVKAFPLTSIRTERQLDAAQTVMDRLLSKVRLHRGERMYLDALSDLVMRYEDEHYPIEPVSDAAMLQHLLEAKGVTQSQVHKDTGIALSLLSEVLSGKRKFSKSMIGKLAEYFHVDKGLLAANL
jgi:HTH-type transcriptional regulator / antitoxin HigA